MFYCLRIPTLSHKFFFFRCQPTLTKYGLCTDWSKFEITKKHATNLFCKNDASFFEPIHDEQKYSASYIDKEASSESKIMYTKALKVSHDSDGDTYVFAFLIHWICGDDKICVKIKQRTTNQCNLSKKNTCNC